MLTSVLILLCVAVLVVVLIGGMMWLDAILRGERYLTEEQKSARIWQPPLARGRDLLNWARTLTARTVGRQMSGKHTASAPLELSAEVHEGATRAMLPSFPDREMHRKFACPSEGQGMIGITAPEVLEIAAFIRHNLPRAERNCIHDLAQANAKRLANLDHTQFDAAETPCPLQGDNRVCCVYASRPLRCRPMHAAMAASRLGMETIGDEGESITWASHAETVERGVEEGLTAGLESAGLDAHVYELNSALVRALDTSDAARRWAKGEDIFAGCKVYN